MKTWIDALYMCASAQWMHELIKENSSKFFMGQCVAKACQRCLSHCRHDVNVADTQTFMSSNGREANNRWSWLLVDPQAVWLHWPGGQWGRKPDSLVRFGNTSAQHSPDLLNSIQGTSILKVIFLWPGWQTWRCMNSGFFTWWHCNVGIRHSSDPFIAFTSQRNFCICV